MCINSEVHIWRLVGCNEIISTGRKYNFYRIVKKKSHKTENDCVTKIDLIKWILKSKIQIELDVTSNRIW